MLSPRQGPRWVIHWVSVPDGLGPRQAVEPTDCPFSRFVGSVLAPRFSPRQRALCLLLVLLHHRYRELSARVSRLESSFMWVCVCARLLAALRVDVWTLCFVRRSHVDWAHVDTSISRSLRYSASAHYITPRKYIHLGHWDWKPISIHDISYAIVLTNILQ